MIFIQSYYSRFILHIETFIFFLDELKLTLNIFRNEVFGVYMIYNIHMYTYFSAIFKCVPYLLLLSYTESLFNDYSHLIIHQQEWLTLTRSRIISI